MWFTDVLIPPDWPSGDFVDEDVPEGTRYDTIPPIDPAHIARTLNEALNRLRAEASAKPTGLDLRGLMPWRYHLPRES